MLTYFPPTFDSIWPETEHKVVIPQSMCFQFLAVETAELWVDSMRNKEGLKSSINSHQCDFGILGTAFARFAHW